MRKGRKPHTLSERTLFENERASDDLHTTPYLCVSCLVLSIEGIILSRDDDDDACLQANTMYSYRGRGLSMGTMVCGWDSTGPQLYYVDDDGTRLHGDVFCVGSGSTYAYGVIDSFLKPDLTVDEAIELGRRAIAGAAHRDAYSGGANNLFHMKETGWEFIGAVDTNELYYKYIHKAETQ